MRKEDTVCSLFGTVHLAQIHWVPLLAVIDIIMNRHLGLNVYDVTISQKPFGIQVSTSRTAGQPATVIKISPKSPAEAMHVGEGHILLAIHGTIVDAQSWHKMFKEAKLPFVVRFRHNRGIYECKICKIAHQFINIAYDEHLSPTIKVVESSSMNRFLRIAIDGYALLLDSSGAKPATPIFSFSAIPWQRGQMGRQYEHYCGVSVVNDPLHTEQIYGGHAGEALGLAITLATILPSIRDRGGEISAIVMDSMNWAANMTSVPPSRSFKAILNLLAHELCAYDRILIVERMAFGQFQGQHNWPPDLIARHKEITHEFAESATTCPTLEESKASLHFTLLHQKNGADVGSTLFGVLVQTVGPVPDAIPWWLTRKGRENPQSYSVHPPEDRHTRVPGPVIQGRRQEDQRVRHLLSKSLCLCTCDC